MNLTDEETASKEFSPHPVGRRLDRQKGPTMTYRNIDTNENGIEVVPTTYFIADENGVLYAHDIRTETAAELILADILTAHPEYRDLGVEIIEG